MIDRGSGRTGMRKPLRFRGAEYTINYVFREYKKGARMKDLASKYGVLPKTLSARFVESGFTWRRKGVPPGREPKSGAWERYDLESYRNPPCNNLTDPTCMKMKWYFDSLDKHLKLEKEDLSGLSRLERLWRAVEYGDDEE